MTTTTGGQNLAPASTKQVTIGGATTPDPYDIQKARHAAIFNVGPAAVHTSIYGQPPPAKQAKLSNDTGFNALPMTAKLAHLSFSRVSRAEDLSPHLLALLNQPAEERFTYFNTHCMKRLISKDPEAWAGFYFTAKFVNDLCNGKLTTNDATESWWNGLIGNLMHRDPNEIKNLNQLHSLIHKRDNSVQFQVNTSTMGKLNAKAPLPPATVTAFLRILKRQSHLLEDMYPTCFTKRVGDTGYHAMVQAGRHEKLERDPNYTCLKPLEALWSLVLVERAEFSHVLSENDFLTNNPMFYYGGNPGNHTHHWTQPTPHFSSLELPLELQPRPSILQPQPMPIPVPIPAVAPPPAPLSQLPPVPSQQFNREGGRGNGRRNIQQQNNQQYYRPQPNANGEHTNNRFHPLFRNHWNNAPPTCQNVGIAMILRGANSNTSQAISLLGLGASDCGLFHIKGCCGRRNCTLLHNERDLPNQQVQQVVNLLRTGQQQLS